MEFTATFSHRMESKATLSHRMESKATLSHRKEEATPYRRMSVHQGWATP